MVRNVIIKTLIVLIFCSTAYSQSAYVDSLLHITELNKQDDAEMKAFFLLALECHRSNISKSKMYLAQDIKLASEAGNYDRLCGAYALLLSFYQEEGKMDSAAGCVNNLKIIAGKAPENKKVQANYNQAMGLYYKKNGDYKTALPYCLAAVKFSEEGNFSSKTDIAGKWLNAGNTYSSLDDYNNALACHLKALRLFEEDGNRLGQSFCYTGISAICNTLKQYGKALLYAQKGLDLKKLLSDRRGICTSLDIIGNIYMGMKNLPLALTNYEAGLEIALAEKMVEEENTSYFNMAKIFALQKKDSLAVSYFKKSKALAIKLENKFVAANSEMELSALYKNTDSLKQTEKVLTTSLQTFKEAGSLEKEAENYKRLSDFYAAGKQYDKALLYTNKYYDIKDSISGLSVQVAFKSLEEQYNSAKKEKEIELLKKDKELQQQKLFRQRLLFTAAAVLLLMALTGTWLLINRNKLKQGMKELQLRNQIAADLHDEVGSSLSSIHMLSQMATQDGSEAKQKDILARMSSNAKETMDKMGDIVWMIKPGETEAGSLKQRMERFAYEICSSKNISASLRLDELEKAKLTMEQRKNIYLIFKEAVNNAVKYSGTEKMEVTASIQNKELRLLVKDFGKGFDSGVVKKGNGLDNMQNRANELGGTLTTETVVNEGTTIQLAAPV